MGCCTSSPYTRRVYRDPGDLDEEIVPLRYFGTNRAGSNLVPQDIDGLPSTHINQHLATDPDLILYEAEIDVGTAFRCYRLAYCCLFTPWGLAFLIAQGWKYCCSCAVDEGCCYVRKEYNTRKWFHVYPNRIMVNDPLTRIPWGLCGCGSWNADDIVTHPFDRGAFGFSPVKCCVNNNLCCIWPIYGQVVARHRCQCNGPLWNRMFDCGGWWCDEWLCNSCFCTFRYYGLADADETVFACSIALQAYYEGRSITREDMDKCVAYFNEHLSERTDPVGRKRKVCCEPYYAPQMDCHRFYECTHPKREIPYADEEVTDDLREVYAKYEADRQRQIKNYSEFYGPARYSTVCRAYGCRRFFGRKGVIFCTEGCNHCNRKPGDPAPPFDDQDFDDMWDAHTVLMKVLGPPPANVVVHRWVYDPEKGENVLTTYPEDAQDDKQLKPHDS